MMELAGRLGYSENEFWAMTPRFFYNAVTGWDLNRKEQWEMIRFQAFIQVKANNLAQKGMKLHDLGYFPWEDGAKPVKIEEDRKKDLINKLRQWQQEAAQIKGDGSSKT